MIKKPTDELMEALNQSSSIEEYINTEQDYLIDSALSDYLNQLLEEKSLKKSTVIKNSELNEIYGYQIFSGKRIPSRDKLISISFGMNLSLDETQALLKYAGFAPLYPKQKRDSLLIWGKNHQFSIYQINELLHRQRHYRPAHRAGCGL